MNRPWQIVDYLSRGMFIAFIVFHMVLKWTGQDVLVILGLEHGFTSFLNEYSIQFTIVAVIVLFAVRANGRHSKQIGLAAVLALLFAPSVVVAGGALAYYSHEADAASYRSVITALNPENSRMVSATMADGMMSNAEFGVLAQQIANQSGMVVYSASEATTAVERAALVAALRSTAQ